MVTCEKCGSWPATITSLGWIQMLVWFYLGWCWLMKKQTPVEAPARPPVRCHQCKVGTMHLVAITDGQGEIIYRRPLPNHTLAYLDSG